MRDEYDFTPEQLRNAVRGKYAARFREGVNLVPIDPDLTEVFPDAEAVNQAPCNGECDSRQGSG
jgi:hypothetical protein